MSEESIVQVVTSEVTSSTPCEVCHTTRLPRLLIFVGDQPNALGTGEAHILCHTCLYLAIKDGVKAAVARLEGHS